MEELPPLPKRSLNLGGGGAGCRNGSPPAAASTSSTPFDVSVVGLGCSSFSTFFWADGDEEAGGFDPSSFVEVADNSNGGDDENENGGKQKSHPRVVRKWIATIRYAVLDAGINLLDTAPWYGHGTSEAVVGYALEGLLLLDDDDDEEEEGEGDYDGGTSSSADGSARRKVRRSDLIVNTKVGRYEADPSRQFDFSGEATIRSVERSLRRLKCRYIDVLQLHDPEFAPSLTQLLDETVPAMLECRRRGYCRHLGLTGYPLEVQHQILLETSRKFGGEAVFDQVLTYGHYNLHDTSLFDRRFCPLKSAEDDDTVAATDAGTATATSSGGEEGSAAPASLSSYAEFCASRGLPVLAAAPLSMGLLTPRGPPAWHPASDELKAACRRAAAMAVVADSATAGRNAGDKSGADNDGSSTISQLALLFAVSEPRIPCTVLGMKDVDEVKFVQRHVAARFEGLASASSREEVLEQVLLPSERKVLDEIRDPVEGPFASLWESGRYQWDGVAAARDFWKHHQQGQAVAPGGVEVEEWQVRTP